MGVVDRKNTHISPVFELRNPTSPLTLSLKDASNKQE